MERAGEPTYLAHRAWGIFYELRYRFYPKGCKADSSSTSSRPLCCTDAIISQGLRGLNEH
jgi:hypothetical protein